MKIIQPSVKWNGAPPDKDTLYKQIEAAGRVCYQSEAKGGDTPEDFIRRTLDRGHEAVIEHGSLSMVFVCDRGITHELVRHRLFSFCQESTRYCNYSNGKFGSEITVIDPFYLEVNSPARDEWEAACMTAEKHYMHMLEMGMTPQQARSVLPNSTKSAIVVTGNIREWRHFFALRKFGFSGTPHPQMLQVANMAWNLACSAYPELFEDLVEKALKRGLSV